MNREKYINNTSYREGYTDGYQEGVNTVVSLLENDVQKFANDLIGLENKLIELMTRTVEPQAESEKV